MSYTKEELQAIYEQKERKRRIEAEKRHQLEAQGERFWEIVEEIRKKSISNKVNYHILDKLPESAFNNLMGKESIGSLTRKEISDNIIQLYENNSNVKEISVKTGIPVAGIYRILRKNDIIKNSKRVIIQPTPAFEDQSFSLTKPNGFQEPIIKLSDNRYRILPQLIELFPKNIGVFIDLFCGSGSIGINMNANKIVLNDKDSILINMLEYFSTSSEKNIKSLVRKTLLRYGLFSLYNEKDYPINKADPKELRDVNKEGFNKLRDDFNNKGCSNAIQLYLLLTYAYGNQYRFNKNNQLNSSVGFKVFDEDRKEKLGKYLRFVGSNEFQFTKSDFRDIVIPKDAFAFLDPGSIIDNNLKQNIINYINELDSRKVRFGLLIDGDWANDIGNFKVANIDKFKYFYNY